MSDSASGQQSQTELRLYFGVCVLQKFQQSGHRDGRFAFGGHSLRAGGFLFGVEPFLKLLAQFYTRGLLDMGVGVYQHICRSVSSSSLNSFHIAAGDHQLIGRTGMTQTVKHDTRELRVCILPFEELLADQYRLQMCIRDRFYADAYKAAIQIVGGEQYILSAVMHADEINRAMTEALGREVYHYHLHVVYVHDL